MEKILVTGASGFLGSWMCRKAKNRDKEVVGTYLENKPLVDNVLKIDLRDEASVEKMLSVSPDVIIHCAAISSVEKCEAEPEMAHEVNVDGARRVAKIAKKLGAAFVLISTNFVFDGKSAPYSEQDETNPIQEYGRTKLEAERIVKEICPGASVIRVSDLYGPSLKDEIKDFVGWLRKEMETGKGSISLVEDIRMQPTYVESAAEEALRLRHESGIFHRTGSDCVNKIEFGRKVAEVFGLDESRLQTCKAEDIFDAPRPSSTCMVSERIPEGKKPVTDEGLTQSLERMRSS